MSKISDKLNIIDNAKNDIKTAIENKGVTVGDVGLQEYAGKIGEIKASVPVTKGLVINAYDSNGYPTDITVVGLTTLSEYAFGSGAISNANLLNKKLVRLILPKLNDIGNNACRYCPSLSEVVFNGIGNYTNIPSNMFYGCSNLLKVIFKDITKVPNLNNTSAFIGTPIANGTGYIYVPEDLVESFKTATNWSTYASQIKGLSELEG